jgi:nitrogen-specific signal transduction histidine kinase
MTVQTIRIDSQKPTLSPVVRFSRTPLGSLWQFFGMGDDEEEGTRSRRDLNHVVERAATELSQKVSSRQIRVEVLIDPLLPLLAIDAEKFLPIVSALADNASASVEPGPATVVLRTWWEGDRIGVDAVGVGGQIPSNIRECLLRPGFSTRVAEWDTGFGLHEAYAYALALSTTIEVVDVTQGPTFRLSVPLRKGTPLSPPDKILGLADSSSGAIQALPAQPPMPREVSPKIISFEA